MSVSGKYQERRSVKRNESIVKNVMGSDMTMEDRTLPPRKRYGCALW